MKKILTTRVIIAVVIIIAGFTVYYLAVFPGKETSEEELLKEALLGSGSAFCIFTESELNEEIDFHDMYVKEGKIKISGTFPEGLTAFLTFKDDAIYYWTHSELFGLRIPAEESFLLESFLVTLDDRNVFFDEVKHRVKCLETSLENEIFDLPEGFRFLAPEIEPDGAEE